MICLVARAAVETPLNIGLDRRQGACVLTHTVELAGGGADRPEIQ
jgi:hypothetical protein